MDLAVGAVVVAPHDGPPIGRSRTSGGRRGISWLDPRPSCSLRSQHLFPRVPARLLHAARICRSMSCRRRSWSVSLTFLCLRRDFALTISDTPWRSASRTASGSSARPATTRCRAPRASLGGHRAHGGRTGRPRPQGRAGRSCDHLRFVPRAGRGTISGHIGHISGCISSLPRPPYSQEMPAIRAIPRAGAPAWHAGGRGFEPPWLHRYGTPASAGVLSLWGRR